MITLILDWRPELQFLQFGAESFRHEGPVPTRPEHDVAHLMIGWHGGDMLWRPQGQPDEVRLAEFNAVYLEVLLLAAGPRPLLPAGLWLAASSVLDHMRWFVEQHYAPFPMPFGEALARFWATLRPERLALLIPFFWEVRLADTPHISRRLDL